MKKITLFLLILSSALILFGCIENGDNGNRETIQASTIDWNIFEDDEDYKEVDSVMNIHIDEKLLVENQSAISETKRRLCNCRFTI